MDAEYRDEIESLKTQDPNFWSIYGLGQWGILKNVIYQNKPVIPLEEIDYFVDPSDKKTMEKV